nr:hypothetical protein CFP56_29432 [Quercus suber]
MKPSAAARSARSSIAVVGWGWEAKDRWWRKRGRGEGKRDGELDRQREAESVEDSAASWIAGGRPNRWSTQRRAGSPEGGRISGGLGGELDRRRAGSLEGGRIGGERRRRAGSTESKEMGRAGSIGFSEWAL